MSEQTFLLSHTSTAQHRVHIIGDVVGRQKAIFIQQIQFELGIPDVDMLIWFLRAVKSDTAIRHTFTGEHWTVEYDPVNNELEQFILTRHATGRRITTALSTAYKLLNALTGKTDRLVKESDLQP